MSTLLWSSPRGSACVELADVVTLSFESSEEHVEPAERLLRRVGMLASSAPLPVAHEAIEPRDEGTVALVARFEGSVVPVPRRIDLARASRFVVSLAEAVAEHHRGPHASVLGPFDPALMVASAGVDRMVFPGLVPLAQDHDRGIRGMRGGGLLKHYRATHDSIRGEPGLPHEVTCLAVLVIELVSGREPYETKSSFDYLRAVVDGRHADLAALVPTLASDLRALLAAALRPDAASRPSLDELVSALGRVAGKPPVSETKPWWRFW